MRDRSSFFVTIVISCLPLLALGAGIPESALAQDVNTLFLPVINVAATVIDTVVVRGRLTVDGAPISAASIELHSCDDMEDGLLATGASDGDGAYQLLLHVAGVPEQVGVALVYPAHNEPPARGAIASFRSICFTNLDEALLLPDIDLGAVNFTSPAKASAVDMPILFAWQPRIHPGVDEVYQVVGSIQYNCANCEPVTVSAASLPYPSSSILLECVYATHNIVLSAQFSVMVSNATGIGYSEPYAFNVGRTRRC